MYKLKAGLVAPASKLNGFTMSSGNMVILLPGMYTVDNRDKTIASSVVSGSTDKLGAAI